MNEEVVLFEKPKIYIWGFLKLEQGRGLHVAQKDLLENSIKFSEGDMNINILFYSHEMYQDLFKNVAYNW